MPRYPKKERPIFNDYSNLPVVLRASHIVDLLDCCEATALKLIRQWDKKKLFPVIWCGNSPRINRDAFLSYFSGGLLTSSEEKQDRAVGE